MSVVPRRVGPVGPVRGGGSARTPMSPYGKAVFRGTGLAIVSAIVALALPVSIGSLTLSILSGLVIGWIRTAWSIRSRFGESFISALFGTSWPREDRLFVSLDLLLRASVGFAVGLTFAAFHAMALPPESALHVVVFGGGGSGGGPGTDFLTLLFGFMFLAGVFALIGLFTALIVCGVERPLVEGLRDRTLAGIGKALTKDAAIGLLDRHRKARPLRVVALQGAVTAVAVALLHRLLFN